MHSSSGLTFHSLTAQLHSFLSPSLLCFSKRELSASLTHLTRALQLHDMLIADGSQKRDAMQITIGQLRKKQEEECSESDADLTEQAQIESVLAPA